MSRGGRRGIVTLAVVAAAWALTGCAAMPDERRTTFGIDFRVPSAPDTPAAIVFMVDGVNATVFREMLDGGRLPNLKKYFVDRGLYFERAIAAVPGVTLPNETSLVTGLWPGHHGVTGTTWFDRNRLVERNYEEVAEKNLLDNDYAAPTLFERLDDKTTLSLFYQAHRGVTKFVENWLSAGPPYFLGWYGFVDRLSLWRFNVVAEIARARQEYPALIFSYVLSPDMEAYRSGISSDAYRAALEHTDAHIGRILRDLEAAGRLDKTDLALVSDHGMVDVGRHWSVKRFLREELHLAVPGEGFWEESPFERRLAHYQKFAAVVTGSGERYRAIYVRKPRAGAAEPKPPEFENWLVRPTARELRAYPADDGRTVDLIERLAAAEPVDLVAYREAPDRVRIVGRKGEAEVSRENPQSRRTAVRVVSGEDPLGYRGVISADGLATAHDDREWLALTSDTTYPDLVPQIMAYFDAPRAGDLIVFAAPGWEFADGHKGGHGGVRPEEMYTVLLFAGPGVPHERRTAPVRTLDLVPTVLELLGRPVPPDLDGRSVLGH